MATLTPAADRAFDNARIEAGNSTDATAYAIVSALRGLALEVAALRDEIALTPERRNHRALLATIPTEKKD